MRDYDTNFKMNPPLRSLEDREALVAAISDGTVDAIATDHAPHAQHEKIIEFERASFGITGLETALGLVISVLAGEHKIPLTELLSYSLRVRREFSTCAVEERCYAAVMPM